MTKTKRDPTRNHSDWYFRQSNMQDMVENSKVSRRLELMYFLLEHHQDGDFTFEDVKETLRITQEDVLLSQKYLDWLTEKNLLILLPNSKYIVNHLSSHVSKYMMEGVLLPSQDEKNIAPLNKIFWCNIYGDPMYESKLPYF